jgi:hypothetical protein
MKTFLLILTLALAATTGMANDHLKKFLIKYAIKSSPTREIVVEGTSDYQARKTFEDMIPRARFITMQEVKE